MDYKGAIADYTKALELDPKSGKAYFTRAVARKEIKDYEVLQGMVWVETGRNWSPPRWKGIAIR